MRLCNEKETYDFKLNEDFIDAYELGDVDDLIFSDEEYRGPSER